MQDVLLSASWNELEKSAFRPFQYLASSKDRDTDQVISSGGMLPCSQFN